MCLTAKGMNDHTGFNGIAHVHVHVLMRLHGLDFLEIC